MDRRAIAAVLVTAFTSLIAAGCGGGSETTTTSQQQNTPTSTAGASGTSTPPANNTTSVTSVPSGVNSQATIQQAIANCKSSIASQTALSGNVKSQLTALCDQAAKNPAAARAQAGQICRDELKNLPPATQAQAAASCPK